MTPVRLGESLPRVDGRMKASGAHRYPSDLARPGSLWLHIVRARTPHARLLAVDTMAAVRSPGVVCILTAADIPGRNGFGLMIDDQPVLVFDRIRYAGEAVAIVVARSDQEARRAADRVVVNSEPLPPVLDRSLALSREAVALHDDGNLCSTIELGHADVTAALQFADVVAGIEYSTPRQEHAFLETEAGCAYYDDGDVLTLVVGGQDPFHDRQKLAALLDLDEAAIRVRQPMMGGAFGGKEDLNVQPYLALATWHTKQPTRLMYDRQESIRVGVKRHSFDVSYRIGADSHGRIVGVDVEFTVDAGAYTTLSPAVTNLAAEHACGPYAVPATRVRGRSVFTNNGNASAFRGFGNPQMVAGLEQCVDDLARTLGQGPVEFRRRNLLSAQDTAGFGGTVLGTLGMRRVLDAAESSSLLTEKARWTADGTSPWKRRGVGVAAAWQGFGMGAGVNDRADVRLRLCDSGRLLLHISAPDMGQGSITAFVQIASSELGVPADLFDVVCGDTDGPNAGSSNASRNMYTIGSATLVAARRMRTRILDAAAAYAPTGSDLRIKEGCVWWLGGKISLGRIGGIAGSLTVEGTFDPQQPEPIITGLPHASFASSLQIVLLEVDTLTGEIEVLSVEHYVDVGRVINPGGVQAQSEGAIAQGLGFALLEDTIYHAAVPQNTRLSTYLIPSVMDVPASLRTVIVEEPEPLSPLGVRGIGEIGISAVAAAVANAIHDAIGRRFTRFPITAELVLEALS